MDQINTSYRDNLNKVQELDHSQINFLRFNIEKFSTVLDSIGKTIRDHADTIGDGTDIVNADTDIKIFIEHHRSDNPQFVREVF